MSMCICVSGRNSRHICWSDRRMLGGTCRCRMNALGGGFLATRWSRGSPSPSRCTWPWCVGTASGRLRRGQGRLHPAARRAARPHRPQLEHLAQQHGQGMHGRSPSPGKILRQTGGLGVLCSMGFHQLKKWWIETAKRVAKIARGRWCGKRCIVLFVLIVHCSSGDTGHSWQHENHSNRQGSTAQELAVLSVDRC